MTADPKSFYLIKLPLPVPPGFAWFCGYRSTRRYVAFSWMPVQDGPVYEDGTTSGLGLWKPYSLYLSARFVQRTLFPFELGSVDQKAHHRLLLDRKERIFYAGYAQDVRRFMEAAQSDLLKRWQCESRRRECSAGAAGGKERGGTRQRTGCGGLAQLMWDQEDVLAFLKMWMSEHL
jgi:hypothetical protein